MGHYKDLLAYQKGYDIAMKIFILSKKNPPEERYSLTDQIRRSSRLYVQILLRLSEEKATKAILLVS
ncbi:four helix bundle protein [Terrimonas pollutisoli]|uniref:four helix bundle protein n=1 Tax=Terrimonas pollutisoli TaxID=3034147 RepID=UPI003F6ACCB2